MIDPPGLELALTTTGKDKFVLAVYVERPDLGAVSDNGLDAMLRGKIPELEECILG